MLKGGLQAHYLLPKEVMPQVSFIARSIPLTCPGAFQTTCPLRPYHYPLQLCLRLISIHSKLFNFSSPISSYDINTPNLSKPITYLRNLLTMSDLESEFSLLSTKDHSQWYCARRKYLKPITSSRRIFFSLTCTKVVENVVIFAVRDSPSYQPRRYRSTMPRKRFPRSLGR